jgi:hypothetical protein
MSKKFKKFKKKDLKSYWGNNKTTSNLPGEKWKPVPGLEETHEVSNYGRLRCLDKMIHPKNGKRPYLRKGHLMSPTIRLAPNYHSKDYTYHPSIGIETKSGNTSFSIRRLVYHCFVEPIELHVGPSPEYLVIPRDGNGLNTHYKNLIKVTKSENELLIYQKNRIPNTFKSLSRKKRVEMVWKGIHKRYRAVSQYDQNGRKIAFYSSMKEASLHTKILVSTIGNAANGRVLRAGGFVWRYGNGPQRIDLGNILTRKMDEYLSKKSQPVSQYDLKGNRIAVYSSIREVCRKCGFNKSTISACLNERLKTAYDFVWQKGIGPSKIKLSEKGFKIKVVQYSADGKMIDEFPSMLVAASKTGIPYHRIRQALIDKKIADGYQWKSK